ncbi:hypothetical protein [Micromonospora costi]|uniref:hypothetical protein n=1 Tax=Micromonospora costi TaxID=1530042 RepID=UPI0011C43E17|nr:hypothetical protein [Micromonospora costi]
MTPWIVLGIVALLFVGCFLYVGRRDRRRLGASDDATAVRDARASQQRYEVERHQSQGETWLNGRTDGT